MALAEATGAEIAMRVRALVWFDVDEGTKLPTAEVPRPRHMCAIPAAVSIDRGVAGVGVIGP